MLKPAGSEFLSRLLYLIPISIPSLIVSHALSLKPVTAYFLVLELFANPSQPIYIRSVRTQSRGVFHLLIQLKL
jgi:hypothetical protein